MAVRTIKNSTKLRAIHKTGVDEEGKDVLKSNTFSSINSSSSNEGLYAVTSAMSALFPFGVSDIQKIESFSIVEE